MKKSVFWIVTRHARSRSQLRSFPRHYEEYCSVVIQVFSSPLGIGNVFENCVSQEARRLNRLKKAISSWQMVNCLGTVYLLSINLS